MADDLAQDQSKRDRWVLAAMADILRAGLSRQDTEELLSDAMEASGIAPDVAETVAIFGGPPILVVPGMGAAEAKERAQRPVWRATYLLAMAGRVQCSVDQSLAQGVPDVDWQPLRAALRSEGPYLEGTPFVSPDDMDPLFWTRFVRIEPFRRGDGHAEGVRRRVPPAGGGPGPLRATSGTAGR